MRKSPAGEACAREYLRATPSAPCTGTGSLGSLLRSWFENFLLTSLPLAVEVEARFLLSVTGWPLRAPFGTYVYVAFRSAHISDASKHECGLVVGSAGDQ